MRLVYVFDTRTVAGTILPCRIPTFAARCLCAVLRHADYWHTSLGA